VLRFVGGCVGRLLMLVLTVAVLAVAWYNRHELMELVGWPEREPEVSAAVADEAAARLAALGDGAVARVAFHTEELQSLILYRWAPFLPEALGRPRVELDAGRITLVGDVPTDRFGIAELRDVIGFLPDTASVRVVASVVPLDRDHVSLEIHELGAAGIPVPDRLIPPILARLRPQALPESGPNALAVPLPAGIEHVYVSGDSLVLTAREGG
jgi:hypothetical protein